MEQMHRHQGMESISNIRNLQTCVLYNLLRRLMFQETATNKLCSFYDIQLLNFAYIQLLNKPYENEFTMTGQNQPLECC